MSANNQKNNQLPGKKDKDRARKLIQSGSKHLSPHKEQGTFLLYMMGDDLDTISNKTGIPKDVLLVTAEHYEWDAKLGALDQEHKEKFLENMEDGILTNLVAATHAAVTQEVADYVTGKKELKDCYYIPKSVAGVQKLIQYVKDMKGLAPTEKKDDQSSGRTVVNAQQVQINNSSANNDPPPKDNDADQGSFEDKRKEFLKSKAGESDGG